MELCLYVKEHFEFMKQIIIPFKKREREREREKTDLFLGTVRMAFLGNESKRTYLLKEKICLGIYI